MKKFLNNPEAFVDETLEGILLAHPDKLKALPDTPRVIIRADSVKPGKTGIITGGGSGHLPTFLGYVGQGMLDACAVGNVFASPSAQVMYNGIKAVDQGAGVLCLYGNYGGDRMNFDMACEMADMDDIICEQIRVKDDLASAPPESEENRRGVAGLFFAYKIAGAAADKMMDLKGVCEVTRRALENIRSIGVATTPCVLPQVGSPTFTINEDEIEIGMGIHGEPGIETRKMMGADELAELLIGKISVELPLGVGDRAALLVNGLGATPREELYIVFRKLAKLLAQRGVKLVRPEIGEFATSMEMAGLSLSVFKLNDEELYNLYEYPAETSFYHKTGEYPS
ncbi:MAG: dihydroxyacetone kinase subunit DhaK [Clostridiales bacterium]|jgi:dihydroxyacetone kinase-like protein|nr:dihydroxyacetone kinase subunit DhaK [Clostridiales bacterium]